MENAVIISLLEDTMVSAWRASEPRTAKVVRLVPVPSPQPGSEKGRMPAALNVPFVPPLTGAISRNILNLMVAGAGFEPATFGL